MTQFTLCYSGMEYAPNYRPRKDRVRCGHCGRVLVWTGAATGWKVADQ